jgi:predicted  nucleic acid-binding Zn-ribbon protein
MADLEDAAAQALTQLKSLEAAMEKTQAGMDEVEHEVERLANQFDTDWSSFEHATEALLTKTHAIEHHLQEAGQQAATSLNELQTGIAKGYEELVHDTQTAVADIGALEQQVHATTPDVAARGDGLANSAKALTQHAAEVSIQMETTFQQVAHFLEDGIASNLRTMKDAVHEAAQHVRDELHRVAQEQLHTLQEEIDHHLDDVEQSLKEALNDAAEHVPAVVDYVTKECEQAHETHAQEVRQVAESLHTVMEKLEAAIEAEERSSRDASQHVERACTHTEQAATTMIQALNSVRDLLARFSLVN